MKKLVVAVLVALMVVGFVGLIGCGEKEEVEVTEDEGTITIEDEEGESSVSEDVDEGELGVPIYPGAEKVEGESDTITTEGEEGTSVISGTTLETSDSFDEVVAWYKEKMPSAMFTELDEDGGKSASFMVTEEDAIRTVTITEDNGKTMISVGAATGMDMDMDMTE